MTHRNTNTLVQLAAPLSALLLILVLAVSAGATPAAPAEPPFSGTIFLDPDIITDSDPSTLQDVSYAGRGMRTMFDRRVNDWITVNAYLFDADFDDGLYAEVQVNPEFGSVEAATVEVETYAENIGRLPTALRADVETVWIHKGTEPFGGGNSNLLIHTGQADQYVADGILEETFVHEASHTSLDHRRLAGWPRSRPMASSSPPMHAIIRTGRTWPKVSCRTWPFATAPAASLPRWAIRLWGQFPTGSPTSMRSRSTCIR